MTQFVAKQRRGRMILALLAGIAFAAPAAMATSAPLTFRGLEHRHSGNERLSLARQNFNARIPAGTPLHEARATLEQAGARCVSGASLSCTHNSYEGVSDVLRHVEWKVDVSHREGAVTGLDIDRRSIGS
jgi:hypothetical protein